jgi:enoyl-CoA hydratase
MTVTERPRELLIADDGHVRTLTIDRPDRANSLSRSLTAAMVEALIDAGEDPDIRAIVITGAGDSTFCGGADLKEIGERDRERKAYRPRMRQAQRGVHEVLWETGKPTIAAVNGHAMGGGLELALACDLRVIADDARLGLPEARLGMGANFATVVLPRLVPQAIAAEILFTAEPFDAAYAARWGLANRVVPRADVRRVAADLAAAVAANAPLTTRRMKETLMKARDLPVASALRLEVGPDPYRSEDREEGIRAHLEKRKPVWKAR